VTIYVLPLLHPAYLLRGMWGEEPAQIEHLRRAKLIADTGEFDIPNMDEPLGPLNPDADGIDLTDWCLDLGPEGCSVDIEAAGPHLVMVGLINNDTEKMVQLRFRRKGGAVWDTSHHRLRYKVEVLDIILSSRAIPKVFQNGQAYDVPYLEELGFVVNNYADDTLLMAHICYPEMPKRLEYLGVVYAGMNPWKFMSSESEGDAK